MRIDILTTFPELFAPSAPAPLGVSIPRRAQDRGLLAIHPTNIRDFADPPHFKTDDRPFGGGPGMVMLAEPLVRAAEAVEAQAATSPTRVLLTPQGERLTQPVVEELAAVQGLLLICGHYEGIDERAIEHLAPREISLGDYVLSSGELAAIVLIDAIARLLPGVLGHDQSSSEDSFSPVPAANPNGDPIDPAIVARWTAEAMRAAAALSGVAGRPPNATGGPNLSAAPGRAPRLLDCPHYTRPRVWRGVAAPDPLFSGDHTAVYRWRLEQMPRRTAARRPDLLPPP